MTQPPAENDPNSVNQPPPPPTQPHQYQQPPAQQQRPVVVQQPDFSGFVDAINSIPEKIVNSLREGASQFVPPAQQQQPPAQQQQPPAAQQLPPAGQQTQQDNVQRSGRQPSKLHQWWNGGQR